MAWVRLAGGGTGRVEYGLTPILGQVADLVDGEAALLGLKPDQAYYWRVVVVRASDETSTTVQVLETPPLPPELPPFELEVRSAGSQMASGYLLTNLWDQEHSFVVIADGDGDIVWWVSDPGPPWRINRAKLSNDGASVLWSRYDRDKLEDIGTIERLALDGSSGTTTRAVEQHHDFVEQGDGTFAWLSWGYTDRSLTLSPVEPTSYDIVREGPEGAVEGDEPRVAFDLLAQAPVELGWVCSHNAVGSYVPGHRDWSHANSIVYEPSEDRWYVQVRYHDALLAIDRTTGALLWALGGAYGEFADLGPEALPKHAHLSEAWPGGFLAFDNQDHGTEISRVVEYAYDEEARTVASVWRYTDPEGRHAKFLGDARRLPGGHRLIAWSPFGEVTEVTPEGDVVWSSKHPFTVGRVTRLSSLGTPAAASERRNP